MTSGQSFVPAAAVSPEADRVAAAQRGDVAAFNQLDNFRSLAVGQSILFPPLQLEAAGR